MSTIESYCLFVIGGLVAYILLIVYCYMNQRYECWCRKREAQRFYRKNMFRQRCRTHYNYLQAYFYGLAINNPRLLATDLAANCVAKMSRKDFI